MAGRNSNRATKAILAETYVMIPYKRLEELLNMAEGMQRLEDSNKRMRNEVSALRLQLTELMEVIREIQ